MMDGQLLLNKEGELGDVQENQRRLEDEQVITAMLTWESRYEKKQRI